MAAPHPSSVNPGSSEDESQEQHVLVKASMVYGLLQINHQLITQIEHELKLYNDLEKIYQEQVAQFQSLYQTACQYADALNRSDSTVEMLTGQLADVTNKLQMAENILGSKALEDEIPDAMDGMKDKIFASGPMEESETNKKVNAEKNRGIQQNLGGMNEEVPLELEVGNQQRMKTKLCCHWEKLSRCSFGDSCCFAYGNHELRPLIPNHHYKTKLCNSVTDGNDCSFGDDCHFAHSSEELRQAICHPQD